MERTMWAAVYEGEQEVAVRELPVPDLADDEVLIEVSHCGICGSDLHFVVEGWSRPGSVHGHEYSGTVVATGPAVHGWSVGDRVVGGPGPGCGSCGPCRAGTPHLCVGRDTPGETPYQGAFATYKALSGGQLFRVPERLDLRAAALTEPLAVALRGVRRSRVVPGMRALVTGAGPIGMLTVAVLRAIGVEDVTVSEPSERRQALAKELGATVIAPESLVAPSLPTHLVDEPFDVAIECSGRAEAVSAALSQLGRAGVLVLSGTGMVQPRLEMLRVILSELTITGSMEYTPDDFDAALELLADDRIPVGTLVEPDDVPLAGVGDAMRRLAGGELAGKVMVVPRV